MEVDFRIEGDNNKQAGGFIYVKALSCHSAKLIDQFIDHMRDLYHNDIGYLITIFHNETIITNLQVNHLYVEQLIIVATC